MIQETKTEETEKMIIYDESLMKIMSLMSKQELERNILNENDHFLLSKGLVYYFGNKVSQDINKSIYFFTLSANQNNTYAQLCLGYIYYENKYVSCDINKLIRYLTLSANQNNSYAQYYLGKIYYENIYVSCDINKSIHYLTLSANQKCESINYKIIENKLIENGFESNELVSSLYQICEIIQKKGKETCKEIYKQIRETDLIYITFQIISLEEFEKSRELQKLNQKPKPKDINKEFYEVFGIDI